MLKKTILKVNIGAMSSNMAHLVGPSAVACPMSWIPVVAWLRVKEETAMVPPEPSGSRISRTEAVDHVEHPNPHSEEPQSCTNGGADRAVRMRCIKREQQADGISNGRWGPLSR